MRSHAPAATLRQVSAIFLVFCCVSNAHAESNKPRHAKISLISELNSLSPGTTDWVGLRFQLEPGWHIYWKNPGDSGEPPKVTWHLPGGIQSSELQFPTPQRIKDHSLIDYGYESDVVLLSRLTFPSAGDVLGDKIEIAADIRYLVCREVCIPGKDHVALTVPFSASSKPIASHDAGLIRKTEIRLPQSLPADVHLSAKSEGASLVVTIASKRPEFHAIKDFLPDEAGVLDNTSTPQFELSNGSDRLTLKKSEQLDHPVTELKGLLVTADRAYDVTIPVTSRLTSSRTVSRKDKE